MDLIVNLKIRKRSWTKHKPEQMPRQPESLAVSRLHPDLVRPQLWNDILTKIVFWDKHYNSHFLAYQQNLQWQVVTWWAGSGGGPTGDRSASRIVTKSPSCSQHWSNIHTLTGTNTILYSKETAHRKSENSTVITTKKSVAMHFGKHHEHWTGPSKQLTTTSLNLFQLIYPSKSHMYLWKSNNIKIF